MTNPRPHPHPHPQFRYPATPPRGVSRRFAEDDRILPVQVSASSSSSSSSSTRNSFTRPQERTSPLAEIAFSRKRKPNLFKNGSGSSPCKFARMGDYYDLAAADRFQSVLDRPLPFWGELDQILASLTEWTKSQRSRMIHYLIQFLELKIGLNDFIPDKLLMPTPPIDQAWRCIVVETQLYQKLIKLIQDFHGKPRKMIHYSVQTNFTSAASAQHQDKLRRTQSLFRVYFMDSMPLTTEQATANVEPPINFSSSSSFSFSSSHRRQVSLSSLSPPGTRHLRQPSLDSQTSRNSSSSAGGAASPFTLPSSLQRPPLPTTAPYKIAKRTTTTTYTSQDCAMMATDEDDASTLYGLGIAVEWELSTTDV